MSTMENINNLFKSLQLKLFSSSDLRALDILNNNNNVSNYTLKDLYKLASDIISLKLSDSNKYYYPHVFQTQTSGYPQIEGSINIPIEIVVASKSSPVTASGTAIVKCRKLNIKDLDGYDIYEACNGVLFIWLYRPIDPLTGYDVGKFTFPRIEFEKVKSLDSIFRKNAEDLVQQITDIYNLSEIHRLTLENRVYDYQMLAYYQSVRNEDLPKVNT